jgi:excisionase family DNA binding protein
MTNLISLAEAASLLGVSKATLRNWDKEGKLKAHRHPVNRYRAYDLEELRRLQPTALLPEVLELTQPTPVPGEAPVDSRAVKKLVARLHGIMRDHAVSSNIVERFDEITKLVFIKLIQESQGDGDPFLAAFKNESVAAYAARIRKRYAGLAKRHLDLFPTRFGTLRLVDETIWACGQLLCSVSFHGAGFDIKGLAYEEVISRTFDKGDNQQYFTPHSIVAFMVAALGPFLAGLVADPACGTGGFLAEVVRSGRPVAKLLGLEVDERLAWVSGINLCVHGAGDFECRSLPGGGTLGNEVRGRFGTVDAILTNPPFGSDLSDPELLSGFELGRDKPSRRRGILFIERCWDLLREGGTLGIIIDEGVLSASTSQDVRDFLMTRFDILAIISLPDTAFMPYATVSASILILRKRSGAATAGPTFFAKAENIGRRINGDEDILYLENGTSHPNSDFPKILEAWNAHLEGRKGAPSEFWYSTVLRAEGDIGKAPRLDFRYQHPSRDQSRLLLEKAKFKVAPLTDLCEERNAVVVVSSEISDQMILYTGLANIESGNGIAHQVLTPAASLKSAVKRYEPGDIVFAKMRPNLRKIALMDFEEGGYVSPECSVLTVRKRADGGDVLDPAILSVLLRSDFVFGQILHLVAGIGRPRLSSTDLRKVRIPVPPPEVQQKVLDAYRSSLTLAKKLTEKAQALMEEASVLRAQSVEELAAAMIFGSN